MILLIDNYDSFTYNLVQMMSSQGADIKVYRNDEITLEQAIAMNPAGLIISPGPCNPERAGVSVEFIKYFSGKIPVMGVCLGHQSMAIAFGGIVNGAKKIMHGKTSPVEHNGTGLFKGMKNPFVAGRYHSLVVDRETLPPTLIITATSDDGEIMGMHHVEHQTYGVQFHPESVLTPTGKRLLRNFLRIVDKQE